MNRSATICVRLRLAAVVGMAVLMASACASPPTPSPTPSAITTASPGPTSAGPSPSAAACTRTDLEVTGGPWGGAAGSRGSDIVVRNVGSAGCLLPAAATVAVLDQAGTVQLTNAPPQAGSGPELPPGGTTGFSLVLSNWCDQAVALPLHFQLALASDTVDVGGLTVATSDDLPPCNGPDQPATLSTTDWQVG